MEVAASSPAEDAAWWIPGLLVGVGLVGWKLDSRRARRSRNRARAATELLFSDWDDEMNPVLRFKDPFDEPFDEALPDIAEHAWGGRLDALENSIDALCESSGPIPSHLSKPRCAEQGGPGAAALAVLDQLPVEPRVRKLSVERMNHRAPRTASSLAASHQTASTRAKRQSPRLGSLWLAACLLLAGFLGFGGIAPSADQTDAGRGISRQLAGPPTTSIEQIQVGQRVIGVNPLLADAERNALEPDPATWRKLELEMEEPDTGRVEIVLLRPAEWLEAQGTTVGRAIDLDLPEIGVRGPAHVRSIGPCPPIEAGEGNVVTGTFAHEAAELIDLYVDGLDQPIGCTPNHPFWSEDRQTFLPAAKLQIGEQLRHRHGTSRVIAAVPCPGQHRVYNLEVNGEHVYCVSRNGILVHNQKGVAPGPTVDPRTGLPVGRFIADSKGNVMVEPVGGSTVAVPGPGGPDTHTLYPNGSNYQRLNPKGHKTNPTPHGHAHAPGTGPKKKGQGPSLDQSGNVVPPNSPDAHFPIHEK